MCIEVLLSGFVKSVQNRLILFRFRRASQDAVQLEIFDSGKYPVQPGDSQVMSAIGTQYQEVLKLSGYDPQQN